MLILSRRQGEYINIYDGDKLLGRITLVEASHRVRLGFEFPREINIVRREIDEHAELGGEA